MYTLVSKYLIQNGVMFFVVLTPVFSQAANTVLAVDVSEQKNTVLWKKLVELASAHILSQAIHVAARLNIAECLVVAGPCSIEALAMYTHTNTDALYRLLRLLASHEIFYEEEKNVFSLTPLAELLLADHPQSLKVWLINHDGAENRWRSYAHMIYSIKTGKAAFNALYGKGYFDSIAENPEQAALFDEGMQNIADQENNGIVTSYNFSNYKMIADIGGGKGGLLAEILKTNLSVYGILYDLPHVISAASDYLLKQNSEKRFTCLAGSFFEEIPCNADLYILKRILHDWNDEDCIKILSNCRRSMSKKTKLLIIEAIIAPGNAKDFGKHIDLAMLVLFGGKERTEHEWVQLLDAAHLKLVHIYKTSSMVSILEIIAD